MLTLRELERMQAEAQKRADDLFARWMAGFMGGRDQRQPREPMMLDEMPEMAMDETDGNVQPIS